MSGSEMPQPRFRSLDGLRGFACLSVTLFHFFSAFQPRLISEQSVAPYWISDTPLGIFYNGGFAVAVFFVLSGFVVASASASRKRKLSITVARRYFRLALPSAASAVIAWSLLTLTAGTLPDVQAALTHPWMTFVLAHDRLPNLFNAALAGGLYVFIEGSSLLNNVLWTMKIELLGSVAIIAIYAFVSGKARITLLILLAVAACALGRPEYSAFMAGALLRECHAAGRLTGSGSLAIFLFAIVVGSWTKGFGDRIGLSLPMTFALGEPHKFWHTLAAVGMVYCAIASVPISRFLSIRPLMFLGRISFGLYLVHVPLLYSLGAIGYLQFGHEGPLELMTLAVLAISVSIIAGYLFTVIVDEPTISGLAKLDRLLHGLGPDGRHTRGRTGNLKTPG